MDVNRLLHRLSSAPDDIMDSEVSGERTVSAIKVLLSVVFLVMTTLYIPDARAGNRLSLIGTATILSCWGIVNAFLFFAVKTAKGVHRAALFGTVADVLVLSLVQVVLAIALPLNMINNPVAAGYFVIVSTAAIRKKRSLVIWTGVLGAIAHLLVTGWVVLVAGFPFYIRLQGETQQFEAEWFVANELIISCGIALFGVLLGYVAAVLRESENHYLQLFHNLPDGILIVAQDDRILSANQRFATMVGLGPEELAGRPVGHYLTGATRGEPTGSSISSIYRYRFLSRLVGTDGRRRHVQVSDVPIDYDGVPCTELSVRDLGHEQQLASDLTQFQKSRIMSRLAGDLAHDFNNLLAGIFGATSLAKRAARQLTDPAAQLQAETFLSTISDCGETAAGILERLKNLYRSGIVQTEPVDVEALLQEIRTTVDSSSPARIKVTVEPVPESLPLKADKISLSQALLNLGLNAVEAVIPGAGHITLSAGYLDDPERLTRLGLKSQDNYVYIKVTDDGRGMDKQVQNRIFEPFFSTKKEADNRDGVHKGVGIGLTMVYNVAVGHGGTVAVESIPNVGTTFELILQSGRDSVLPMIPSDSPSS